MTTNAPSAFLAALQKRSTLQHGTTENNAVQAKPEAQIPENHEPPLEIRVERVLDRRRLDLFFSRKPDEESLQVLRTAGFRFRPSDKAWYHADTPQNRQAIGTYFSIQWPETQAVDSEAQPLPELTILEAPQWARYKQQVKELLEHTKLDCADLQLFVVDLAHKALFGKN